MCVLKTHQKFKTGDSSSLGSYEGLWYNVKELDKQEDVTTRLKEENVW